MDSKVKEKIFLLNYRLVKQLCPTLYIDRNACVLHCFVLTLAARGQDWRFYQQVLTALNPGLCVLRVEDVTSSLPSRYLSKLITLGTFQK